MKSVDPRAFEFALKQIKDGDLFERFAQDLLCQILGQEFLPIGGTLDKGIDGLEHCLVPKGIEKTIYQISIEKDPETKIRKTICVLKSNKIKFNRFFYVTNQKMTNQDALMEKLYENYKVNVICRDVIWLRGNVNKNEGTIRTYMAFIENNMHEFANPGASYTLTDLTGDPRVFVFLRQQWEDYGKTQCIDKVLVDSLIIYSLEGTDPDKNIFKTRREIVEKINTLVGFSPRQIEAMIDDRLNELSSKPNRRINYHSLNDSYCLPYNTRLELEEKNLSDKALHEAFLTSSSERLKKHLLSIEVKVQNIGVLLQNILNNLFKQQGLEFADFVLSAENQNVFEKSLPEIVSNVVETSSVIPKNRSRVKEALLSTIREVIYRGTPEENEFLRKLSNSYMMLFLLQCDPKISTYFSSMASKLNVFVCTSILIPALSELPLDSRHRRHWNLLLNAHRAGVKLNVTRVILDELIAHIKNSLKIYKELYSRHEDVYKDEAAIQYIPEILIRSYFYSKLYGREWNFKTFIENFVTPDSNYIHEELIEWLKETFGVDFIEEKSLGVNIEKSDIQLITKELGQHKHSFVQARSDARTVLYIYALREKNNETGVGGIFGYRTWWLSKDTLTQRAIIKCFGKRFPTSCYIRPDFLYNYISLAPNPDDTERVFNELFPTLIGVSISHHLPEDVMKLVHKSIEEHSLLKPARVKAILRTLADRLKSDLANANIKKIKHYLDEEFSKSST